MDQMSERLLFAAFILLGITLWVQPLQAQVMQAQNAASYQQQLAFMELDLALADPAPVADQQPATQSDSAPVQKPSKSSSLPDRAGQSSTVGDPESSTPLKVKGKFHYFAVETFRPGIYPVAAFYTGLTMAAPPKAYPHEWRAGFPAFARNYGDFMGSWAAVQGGKFAVAALTHEDPRYFPSQSKNFFARCFHAARYAIIDRGDNGHSRLALANLSGAFAGGFVGNAYLPDPYANTSHALSRSALGVSGFATSNLADEFWPDIHQLAKKLHIPLFGY